MNSRLLRNRSVNKLMASRLNNLFSFLGDIYDINSGGCCYIAYLIAKLLESDNISYKVVVYNRLPIKGRKFSKLTHNCNHYCISVGDYLINNDNWEASYTKFYSKVSSDDLLQHYLKYTWNDDYDTSENEFLSKVIPMFYYDFTKDLREE